MHLTTTRIRRAAVAVATAAGLALAIAPGAHAAAVTPPDLSGLLPATSPPGTNDFTCKPTAAHPSPVVLVHGTFEDATENWSLVAPQIKAAGYCIVPSQSRHPATPPSPAGQRERSVDAVLAAAGARKVSLVGHSQGGMMPRWYIKFLGGAAKVDDLVGLAPSNHGTTNPGAFPTGATF